MPALGHISAERERIIVVAQVVTARATFSLRSHTPSHHHRDGPNTKVLVAYATKHGSTKGIADFIGEKLRQEGLSADVLEVGQVRAAGEYDAFVLGSGLYYGHWMKEAKRFASNNSRTLSARPIWLFSSGPTGRERTDSKGRDLLDPMVSGPIELNQLVSEVQARGHKVFFGSVENAGLLTHLIPKSQKGDFRDWKEIESWAVGIAASLREAEGGIPHLSPTPGPS
jgi:menaquinone-dependent protoporphyrinogen oxidase